MAARFVGQIWTLFSLQRGDVSIATPVLGVKILLVALFTTLVLRWRFVGAALMFAAIVLVLG